MMQAKEKQVWAIDEVHTAAISSGRKVMMTSKEYSEANVWKQKLRKKSQKPHLWSLECRRNKGLWFSLVMVMTLCSRVGDQIALQLTMITQFLKY